MQIHYVTSNKEKFLEASYTLKSLENIDFIHTSIDLQELQGTRQEIANHKAWAAFNHLKQPVITDDVSLCCDALNGFPGPYVKYFFATLGIERCVQLISSLQTPACKVICTLALCDGKSVRLFEGVCDGILVKPRGSTQYGKCSWTPIFQPHGSNKTLGEMTVEEISAISHRHRALLQLKQHVENL